MGALWGGLEGEVGLPELALQTAELWGRGFPCGPHLHTLGQPPVILELDPAYSGGQRQ
jgi:hypothetical protein